MNASNNASIKVTQKCGPKQALRNHALVLVLQSAWLHPLTVILGLFINERATVKFCFFFPLLPLSLDDSVSRTGLLGRQPPSGLEHLINDLENALPFQLIK